ncbi:MAG: cytochrome c oxidase subunit II [Verrucomicrobiia bacterium]
MILQATFLNTLLGLPESASAHGWEIDQMLEFCHWFMLILLVGWSGYFGYTLWRFRASRNPRASYHGVKNKVSTHLEVGVVIVEAILLVGFAFPLWAKRVNDFPDPEKAVEVHVFGEQFGWSMHYPGEDGIFGKRRVELVSGANPIGLDPDDPHGKDDIVARNTMHLPVNRPAILKLTSKDVIHNFALHQMRAAHDAIPGTEIPMWFTPIREGEYEIICGQLCGAGHSVMKGILIVESAEEYEEWKAGLLELRRMSASL